MMAAAGTGLVRAELPALENDKVWNTFYFVGHQLKGADLGLDTGGKIDMIPIGKNRERLNSQLYIPVLFAIEDVGADGKAVAKKIDVDSLTSETPATSKPSTVVVKGKIEDGDTTFEINYEVSRGLVLLGGRILEKGSLANPKFSIKVNFPKVYENVGTDEKAFKKRIEDDFLEVKLLEGKKAKVEADEEFDITSPEFTGTGVSQAEVRIDALGAREFTFLASPNSKLSLANSSGRPFYEGLKLTWEADLAKDPQGKARLAIGAK